MALEIGNETISDFRVLRLKGRLDTETSADFELAAHDLTEAGDKRFIVDLSEISYVSSAGLRVLLALAKQTDDTSGGVLRLSGMSSTVRQVFDLSGFSKLFHIAPDLDAALRGDVAAATPSSPSAKVSRTAADLLGASGGGPSRPAPRSADVGRQAGSLLGAPAAPKRSLWARILGWFKGQ